MSDRNCTHLAGEYFVAAELSRRGYAVGITMGNAKAVDLVVEKDARTAAVQVKAIAVKKNVGWPITRQQVKSNVVYVFVCLNAPGTAPSYFILTANEAKKTIKEYSTRSILNMYSVKGDDFQERWDKIEKSLR